jgi:cytochrome c oxidase subunit 2
VKKAAIPGFINQASFTIAPNKPGVYRGQCAELCGRDHAFMPIVVRAVSPAQFSAWIEQHTGQPTEAAAGSAAAQATRT